MNPWKALLAPLEKLITEHGSAAIQTKHIALLKDQFSFLEKEKVELAAEIKTLQSKISVLESEVQKSQKDNEELRAKIKQYEEAPRQLQNKAITDFDPLNH